jgi:hypothetical protein
MKGDLMSLRQKYRRILSAIVPAGAAGVSLLLGTTVPSAAADHPAGLQPSAAGHAGISERLAAIREAVSEVAEAVDEARQPSDRDLHLAWGNWWNNWGWGRPWGGWGWPNWNNWRNWNNWNNWWRNW